MRALLLLLIPALAHADREECVKTGGRWITNETGTGCMRAGKRDGVWEKRTQTGQLITRQQFTAGVLDGPAIAFDADSCEIASKGAYKAGAQDGPWIAWFDNGQKSTEGSYTAGLREGVWKFYTNDVAVMEGPMVADAANGTFTERFATGVEWRKAEVVDGQRTTPEAKACAAKGGTFEIDHRARNEGCLVDGQREGTWFGYAGDGKLEWRSEYVKNEQHGERIDYHPGGQILRRGRYVEDVPDGLHEFKSATGQLYGASTITNGTGAWKAFFAEGIVAEDGAYANGVKDGLWRTFHRKGAPLDETKWKSGERDGPYRKHYITGELEVTGEHRANKRAGRWLARYTNGNLVWIGGYDASGLASGFFYFGNFNGSPSAFGEMLRDRRHGMWTQFHGDGKLQGIGAYMFGRKTGPWFEWWPSGQFWRVVNYVNDIEDSAAARACIAIGGVWISDDNERALGCQVCRSSKEDDKGPVNQLKIGAWTWWHANAAIEKQGAFVQGERDGHWQSWFDNGQLMLDTTFRIGKEQGPARGFFRDGKQRFEGTYVDGAEDGEWTTFHGDGS
ncbi:MAG TPA: hypothetical protein VFO79_09665, partial [Xanthomonadales bacterium]|nr:hypothetical protein [Xanthomonadales bacterium]